MARAISGQREGFQQAKPSGRSQPASGAAWSGAMAYTWNATVQRAIGFNSTIEISYVGGRGSRGQRERDQLRPSKGFGQIRLTNNEANALYNGLQVGLSRRFSKGFMYSTAYTWSKSLDSGSTLRDILPNSCWGPGEPLESAGQSGGRGAAATCALDGI